MKRQIILGIIFIVPMLAFFSMSCDKDSTTEPKTETIMLTKITGDNQQGVQGDTLSKALTVLVTEKDGKAVSDKQVNFTIKEGKGTLSAENINTDENGQASAILILGDQQGKVTVEVKISGTNITVLFTAIVGINKPYSIYIASGGYQQGFPSETLPVPLQVIVMDEQRRPFEGAVVTFNIEEGSGFLSILSDSTNVDGIAETWLTTGDDFGTIKVTASTEGIDYSVEFTMTIMSTSLIAFASLHNNTWSIYVMNTDGSNQTLIRQKDHDGLCSWTPDGKIGFYNYYDGIFTVNPNGSNLFCISSERYIVDATWSPDGSKIAYAKYKSTNQWDIYIMNSDGSNKVQLTNNCSSRLPRWSPDGTKIAYQASYESKAVSLESIFESQEINVMNSDGTNKVQLTNNSVQDTYPRWSPDGSKIAFWHSGENYGVYTMNADGSNQIYTNDNPPYYFIGSLSPDGTKIAYSNWIFGQEEGVFVMNIDGSNKAKIAKEGSDPLWSPIIQR